MADPKRDVDRERREFLRIGAAATAGLVAGGLPGAEAAVPAPSAPGPARALSLPDNPRTPAAMPTRNLGRTGYRVGIFSLGGQAAIEKPETRPSPSRSSRGRSTSA